MSAPPVLRRSPALILSAVLALSAAGCRSESENRVPPLAVDPTLPLPPRIDRTDVLQVVSDGDGPTDNEPAWLVAARGRESVTVRQVKIEKERAALGPPLAIRGVPRVRRLARSRVFRGLSPRRTTFDVARWNLGDESSSLFVLSQLREGVGVTIRTLAARGRLEGEALAPMPRPGRGVRRELAIATWSGFRPDLFVVDRGPRSERLQLTIYAGETGFRQPILRLKLPYRGLPAGTWDVDVGRVTQPQPDLVLVSRDPKREHTEIHVLTGEVNFQSFGYDRAIDLPSTLSRDYRFTFGVVAGSESLLGLNLARPGRGKLELIRLFERVTPL